MTKELEVLSTQTNFFPRRLQSGINDPNYLESLAWGKGIKVINYLPNVEITTHDFTAFRNNYLLRQTGLIERLNNAGAFITKNNLQKPDDIKPQHKVFLRDFILGIGVFFSQTLPYSLNAKQVEVEMEAFLSGKYPHLDRRLLLTPSLPYSPIIRDLKLAEYKQGRNEDFVFMFCGGNKTLADQKQSKLSAAEEENIRDSVREIKIKKDYFMIGRPDIKLLDDILNIDNTLESWLWRGSFATAPLFHIYNLMQETVCPSGKFVKSQGYTFDLKLIRENF